MSTFEIYRHSLRGTTAVKRGFSWPGFFLAGFWALGQQLWVAALLLLAVDVGLTRLALGLTEERLTFVTLFLAGPALLTGFFGNGWRSKWLQDHDWDYLGAFEARSAGEAVQRLSVVGGVIPEDWKSTAMSSSVLRFPRSLQQLFAISWLTCKAAWSFRLFPMLATILLLTAVGLPLIIRDDGTARGLTQILITYTLGITITILGFATLWLACGTLARDVEECQIQMVAVKPVPRWQIWLGKWLGIMFLNALLLGVSGVAIYFIIEWRASRLPEMQQAILRTELLVARASAREKVIDFDAATDRFLAERMKQVSVPDVDLAVVRKQIKEQLKAEVQIVAPGFIRRWVIDPGMSPARLQDRPMHLRVKYNSAQINASPQTYMTTWVVGPPESTRRQLIQKPLTTETFHELTVAPNLFDKDGRLVVELHNYGNVPLVVSPDDGLEVLYREGPFALNFLRALMILFFWLGVLAALGLASASYLSFPVAAFLALSVLAAALSSGTIAVVVKDGNLMGGPTQQPTALDNVAVPVLKVVLDTVNLVLDFSPIDSLSTGRSITWAQTGRAFTQIWLIVGGVLAAIGITIFTRRELATAQGTQ